MASKKYKPSQETLSKSRRTAKSWSKGSSEKQFYAKKKQWDEEEDAVPNRAVSMSPRLKNIQQKTSLPSENTFEGHVIDSTGRSFIVQRASEEINVGALYDCVVSRSVVTENPASTLVAVGDRVLCRAEPVSGEIDLLPGVIIKIAERRTKLARESAGNDGIEQVIVSNIDQVIILMAAADPFYNRRLIDRYLIAAELGNVEPIICINKMDLMDETFVREDLAMYAEFLGIKTLFLSAEKKRGLETLSPVLQGKTTVFSGPSGVGKSTLVNMLIGEEAQITTEVSAKTQKGLHTTTFSKIFPLPEGGYILDTPGIREFGIWDMTKEDLAYYFHDFDEYRLECRFTPCTHTHEPGCAVKGALEQGWIDPERYESYLNILETLER
ncbi:MAG: ribosome small subunit-dependent GTPase A [Candidatus Kapabacteria bacterium]|jgi:ribosome biogenesis GTPase|nr:ribosome small subunit-dependent GTPase A [Candidatus Kapabacteria bacterium]